MKIKTITNALLKQYPLTKQEEWDESGYLNKGDLNQDINKVYTCLDLNEIVIDQAIKNKVKLIISHHPIFTKNKDEINSVSKRIIKKIRANKITVLSLHTCFDLSDTGMNMLIGTILRLKNLGWYKSAQFVTGTLPKTLTVKQIANLFKNEFGVTIITTNANENNKYTKLAICAGSGLSCFAAKYDELAKQKILLVTGDIKHHGWQDLSNYKLAALDVGHDLENCFVNFMGSYIKSNWPELDVVAIATSKKEKVLN